MTSVMGRDRLEDGVLVTKKEKGQDLTGAEIQHGRVATGMKSLQLLQRF